ncbi:hypothetical protein COV53_02225 [Candidatus Gottesmanbacteria bacterium CG11_big_fil_rev_8_21_14_0_20_37_11]|uniref:Uncharacterized protein n=1 Tax=Candidatus Gottesmanbacteria bacterium CG11_big_fil_rev_8_21_14_0_20_37_11 TaxID=1974575 RepID=A0A2H0NK49_9BACT|nr:MAG: hypothetical protein COX23_04385 [Candidatus Gottesmanbacteria bacterium CG23_combo_of_CG06-09_8_20_14_all_37_19]PIR08596.1 MAG: hypothetical protein COV53_02225 [Candidatus Gottesmanbacteria bacterium CG11_big_fil_rev_8_21_14_0_20_37_11]
MRGYITHSDLFQNIYKGIKFDLIVFNHFYRPEGTGIFGPVKDGGKIIVQRFLKQTKTRLNVDGIVLMSFVEMSDHENDPYKIANKLGYKVKIIFCCENYKKMGRFSIYKMQLSKKSRNLKRF